MNRVDSARLAVMRARGDGLETKGTVCASDAFFPFRDGLDVVAEAGATAVIHPGGSRPRRGGHCGRRRARHGAWSPAGSGTSSTDVAEPQRERVFSAAGADPAPAAHAQARRPAPPARPPARRLRRLPLPRAGRVRARRRAAGRGRDRAPGARGARRARGGSRPTSETPLAELRLVVEGQRIVVAHDRSGFDPRTGQALLDFPELELERETRETLAPGPVRPLIPPADAAEVWFERAAEWDGDPEQWEAAVDAYERVLAIDPAYAAAWNNLGLLQHRMGHYERAGECYRAALGADETLLRRPPSTWARCTRISATSPPPITWYRRALEMDAGLRRRPLQPRRRAGQGGTRRGRGRPLAALPRAGPRQPLGPDRALPPGADRGSGRAGRVGSDEDEPVERAPAKPERER